MKVLKAHECTFTKIIASSRGAARHFLQIIYPKNKLAKSNTNVFLKDLNTKRNCWIQFQSIFAETFAEILRKISTGNVNLIMWSARRSTTLKSFPSLIPGYFMKRLLICQQSDIPFSNENLREITKNRSNW